MRGMCDTEQRLVISGSKSTPSVASVPEAVDDAIPNHHHEPIINLDHGDPTMYESYWKEVGQKYGIGVTIPGFQSLSYFANTKNLCWFLEPKLEEGIKRLHNNVGNAIVEDRHVIVGTGSSQLILAALYALSDALNYTNPVSVLSAAPYYSSYPEMIDFLRTGLFKWSGDARCFEKDEPYIEMVTSPNNPDGAIREPVVNGAKGALVHDLAYYWPQYTAITSPADHDIMLFTVSKCTGHAGTRIGWALVRDENIARKMVKFIEINTIGVSKEAQLRAANIMESISLGCQRHKPRDLENFFKHSRHILAERWKRLRDAVYGNEIFSLPKFPRQYCCFTKDLAEMYPAFAWMKCKDDADCEKLLRGHKIVTRSGRRFGSGADYVRVSMLSRDEEFDLFVKRLSAIHGIGNGN